MASNTGEAVFLRSGCVIQIGQSDRSLRDQNKEKGNEADERVKSQWITIPLYLE